MSKHDPLKPNARVHVGEVTIANDAPIAVFAGPCQMESRAHALEMAVALKEIAARDGTHLQVIVRQGEPHVAVGPARYRARGGIARVRRNPRDAAASDRNGRA